MIPSVQDRLDEYKDLKNTNKLKSMENLISGLKAFMFGMSLVLVPTVIILVWAELFEKSPLATLFLTLFALIFIVGWLLNANKMKGE